MTLLKRNALTLVYITLLFIFVIVFWKYLSFEHASKLEFSTDLLTCDDFKQLSESSVIGEGWIKTVNKGYWSNIPIAIKTINENGHSMELCKKSHLDCVAFLQNSLMQEARILQRLNHPSIIKLLGVCFSDPSALHKDSLLVELGEPLDSFSLVQKDFQTRLQLARDLSSLLMYLYNQGGILLPDLRLQQFVNVKGHLKLCDVDDLLLQDSTCVIDSDCASSFSDDQDFAKVPCRYGICNGLNDLLNVWRACRTIFPYLLSFGAPKSIQPAIDRISECKESAVMSSSMLEESLKEIVHTLET